MTLMIYFRNQHKKPKFLHTEPSMVSFEKGSSKDKEREKIHKCKWFIYDDINYLKLNIIKMKSSPHRNYFLKNEDMNSHN